MSTPPFVHLHCHSHYSLLDGAGTVDRLVDRAKELGMNSLALTDHGNLFGALEFYQEATGKGIKPIIGYEAYVAPTSRFQRDASSMKEAAFHLTLLAQNLTGFRNLLKLASSAFLEGFYFRPRIDKKILQEHSEGLICLSGCVSSELNRALVEGSQPDLKKATDVAEWYRSVFGDRYFIEVQNNGLDIQQVALEGSFEVARRLGIPVVATSDVHYVEAGDADAQDILLCVNTGKFRTDVKRMKMETKEFYLRSPEEMYAAFPGYEDAVRRSQEIADSVNIELELGKRHFPIYTPPDGKSAEQFLRELVLSGLKDRYKNLPKRWDNGELSKEVMDRVERELYVINKLGFPNYFLIVWDFVRFARSKGIEATARGSGVGSLVAYSLYLSHVCPLEYDLLFERFLDENRKEAPDIDIDFDQQRRGEVIQYVKEKYGMENVAQIGTFGTLAARAAIRDVGRALGLPIPRVNGVVAMVPEQLGITLEDALEKSDELKKAFDSDAEVRELLTLAKQVEGLARNVGTHAAAVVISDRPLDEYLPLQRVQGKEEVITQWAMADVEKAGLLKMDFLGLRNLTILSNVVKLIEQTTGQRINPYEFPVDDKATYELLCRGETKGVFQLESGGIRDLLQRMKPNHFRDIIATNALYRPGPLEGGMVDDYIQVKHGRKEAEYKHPVMKDVLEETHGVMCIHEDARIAQADGTEKPIRDVRKGDRVHALNLETHRFEVKDCHGCGPTRRCDGLRITLSNGFSVTLTPDHKVLTYDGFKEAQQLDPEKDLVAGGVSILPEKTPNRELASWLGADKDVAYLLGQLVGDGCLTGVGISLASGRRRDHRRLMQWFGQKLPKLHLTPYHHERSWFIGLSCPDLLNHAGHGNRKTRLHHWLESLGMKVTAKRKRVPEPIFRSSAVVRRAFLAGLLDSDGCLAVNQKGVAICFLSSVSDALFQDVRRLCQLEGIPVTLRKNRIQLWNVQRTRAILQPFLVTRTFRGRLFAGSTTGCVPRQAVVEAIPEGESRRAFCRRTGIERSTLRYDDPFAKSSTAVKAGIDLGDVRYFRIASIERVIDQQFYGMSVADHHNLVANGIVVKNCYQEQVMRILNRLGGIKLANAYSCIKAISKKKLPMIAKFREEFLEGAQVQGLPKNEAEELFGLIEKFAGYGFNKCVVGETTIVDADTGERATVEDLFHHRRPFRVHSLGKDERLRPREVTDVVWNGKKPVYEVVTASGRRITATANHPLRTRRGWTWVGELQSGDEVAAATPWEFNANREGGSAGWSKASHLATPDSTATAVLCRPVGVGEYVDEPAGIFWDTVERIEPRGVQDTYDLTVAHDHNFVADGLIVHNSHSTAYALVAYMTAYLKAHWPVEFMAALLTSDMPGRNFKTKDSLVEHLEDCQRMHIEVVPPDVNSCGVEFTVADAKVFFGLAAIKGCGGAAAEAIVQARAKGGPFRNIFDFCERLDTGAVNRTAIESLIKAGAMDKFGARRAQVFQVIDRALQSGASAAADRRAGQKGLFDDDEQDNDPKAVTASLPDVPEWEERDKLNKEKEVLGFYLSSHPLAQHADTLRTYCSHTTVEAAALKHRSEVLLGGMLSAIKIAHTKNPRPGMPSKYAMFDLEDTDGIMRCIVWPEQYAQFGEMVQPEAILGIKGSIDKRPGSEDANLIVNELITMEELAAKYTKGMVIRLVEEAHGVRAVEQLYEILRGYPGTCELQLVLWLADGTRVHCSCEGIKIEINPELRGRVEDLLGTGNVRLIAAPVKPSASRGNGRPNGRPAGRG